MSPGCQLLINREHISGIFQKNAQIETGLSVKTKVIMGAMDQVCGAVGAGNVDNGMVTETTGSAFAMIITTGVPVINKEFRLPFQCMLFLACTL